VIQIVNTRMGELYFAMPKPPVFAPDIKFVATIVKTGARRYNIPATGETLRYIVALIFNKWLTHFIIFT